MIDGHTGTMLTRLYPLDKARNADGQRRGFESLTPGAVSDAEAVEGMAPLLRKLMEGYAATGLPPAYLPKPTSNEEDR